MKKLFGGLILFFAGVFVFAGCGSSSSSTTAATTAATTDTITKAYAATSPSAAVVVAAGTTYPNATLLVSGANLDVNATNQVIIDTRTAALYAAGHITNAVNIEPKYLDSTTSSTVIDPTTAAAALSAAGVSNTAHIIVYGTDVDAATGRVFWALEYLGAGNVSVLDGGYAKWVVDGRTVVTTATTPTAATFTATVDATKIATLADVQTYSADTAQYAIIDSRDKKDYVAGHIPSAINALTTDYLNPKSTANLAKTVLSYVMLKDLLDFKGITSGKKVITHCYVGYRSGQEYFIFRLMGFDVRNYDGSWTEWNAATTYPNAGLLVTKTALVSPAIVIDARSSALYAAGHIPGAINVAHSDYWTAGTGLKATATLEAQLGAAGITRTDKIVIYDNTTASWGAAGRLFWMLEYLGCTDVHILNGGYDKWIADTANTAETTVNTLTAATFTASVQATKKLTGAEIAAKLANANFAVIDARTDEEFNGWKLYGETRGGHIPGAYNIPYATFYNTDKTTVSYQTLKQMFESHGITTDKEVTSYCTAGIRSGYVYFLLRLMGYANASNYDASMFEWSAANATTYPEEKASNYQVLVNAAWVQSVIDYHTAGGAVPLEYTDAAGVTYPTSHKYVILDSEWGVTAASYTAGHVTGAIYSDTDQWETGPLYNLLPDADLQARAGVLGINSDTTVIVYSSSGGNFEARIWWVLKYIGVTDVRMLNGSYAAWIAAGYTGETTVNSPTPVTFTGTVDSTIRSLTPYVETTGYLKSPSPMIDTRGDLLYLGIASGYSYTYIAGRVPGAILFSSSMTDADGTYRSYTEVKHEFDLAGITATSEANFYCGDGYGASQYYLMTYLMGYTNKTVYTDGWNTWSSKMVGTDITPSGRPIKTGIPGADGL